MNQKDQRCTWTRHEDGYGWVFYQRDCDMDLFTFMEESTPPKGFKFCPYCQAKIDWREE